MSTAPILAPPRMHLHRHNRRVERNITRQIQNTEILTLSHQAKLNSQNTIRDAELILLDPDTSLATRQAAERILTAQQDLLRLLDAIIAKEAEDVRAAQEEAGELGLEEKEIVGARPLPKAWRPGEALL